jgi:hypothetical protein
MSHRCRPDAASRFEPGRDHSGPAKDRFVGVQITFRAAMARNIVDPTATPRSAGFSDLEVRSYLFRSTAAADLVQPGESPRVQWPSRIRSDRPAMAPRGAIWREQSHIHNQRL